MGNPCATLKYGDGALAPNEHNDKYGAPKHTGHETHALVVCLNYPNGEPKYQLTATDDGDNIQDLLQKCGVSDVTVLYNDQGTKAALKGAMADISKRCKPGDYFVFYYSGHGGQVPDLDNEEDDGLDEALCLVDSNGKITAGSMMTDDEVAAAFTSSFDHSVNIVILADCCHSAGIADFNKDELWGGVKAVSFSGCADAQESDDTGSGGVFTHSLLMAISKFSCATGTDDYSCAQIYNQTIEYDSKQFGGEQLIAVMSSSKCSCPSYLAWPLIPQEPYESPQHKKSLARHFAVEASGFLKSFTAGSSSQQ